MNALAAEILLMMMQNIASIAGRTTKMKTSTERAVEDILQERLHQIEKWGGDSHDDMHGSHDWLAFITKHTGRAVIWPWSRDIFRQQMIKIAALAIAAIEWCDRNQEQL